MTDRRKLMRFAWLAIAAALVTIALKVYAWRITDSVGLLSDAAESLVNLAAAVMALIVLRISAKAPDRSHNFGHSKAEYFSSAIEGILIFIAAGIIMVTAVQRLIEPQPLANLGLGVVVSLVASVVNGLVGWTLVRAGRRHRSMALTADGKHLLTDVITSVGVVVGVVLVLMTGWTVLDPIVALVVSVNIMWTGWRLIAQSSAGLMDASLPQEEYEAIRETLDGVLGQRGLQYHALRTRQAGHLRFMSVHVLVPGRWTVQRGHDLITALENLLEERVPGLEVLTHLEPVEDPVSFDDPGL